MIFKFFGGFKNLIDFGFVNSLDVAQFLLRGHDNTGNGAKTASFEFGDVCSIDSVFLQLLNLDEIGLFDVFKVVLHLFLNFLFLVLRFFFLLHGVFSQR